MLSPEAQAHAAAMGDEMRRIGEEVARKRNVEKRLSLPNPLHQFVPVLSPDEIEQGRAS